MHILEVCGSNFLNLYFYSLASLPSCVKVATRVHLNNNFFLLNLGFVQNLSLSLWKVEWLTVLYLDNNHLSHLPSQIGSLVNLEHLDASHNFILRLPPEIGELVNLHELKLGSNRIQDLPCELGKCFQLQTLGEFYYAVHLLRCHFEKKTSLHDRCLCSFHFLMSFLHHN